MRKIFFIVMIFIFFTPSIYANKDGVFNDGKTIKDLRKDIENLKKISIELDNKTNDFLKENNLSSYIKKGLTNNDISKIKEIVHNYTSKNNELNAKNQKLKKEEDLIKMQNSFLEVKKDLYKSLTVYIDPKNYNDYLNYVENDLKNFVEKNNLQIAKTKTQANYSKKVDVLERKISENKQNLDQEVKNLIDQKLDKKISTIVDSPSFLKLNSEEKIKTLEKVIENLNIKISSFKSTLENNIYIESEKKKIEVYKTMVRKLKEVANDIK